jgi:hypothetical protein
MSLFSRLISIALVLVLAGGAQACVHVCSQPAKSADPTSRAKPGCQHCGKERTSSNDPAPAPQAPCKHCQVATQDRVSAERDHLAMAAADLAVLAPVPLPEPAATLAVSHIDPHPVAHHPPGELLHQFCLLLI